jgi:hypothetical protein
MEDALRGGSVDLIGLGRPMCVDPELPGKLLRGELTQGPAWEHRLSLPIGALGADTSLAVHKQVETWGKQGWFCLQLIRLGNGLEPDLDMSVLDAFNRYVQNEAQAAAALWHG